MNQYLKPKNKNAVIILSTGFFLWGKSMGYKGLSVGEVCINNNICNANSYGEITEKENIGKIMLCNSHHAFLENSCKIHTNMSVSGVVIPAFDVSDNLNEFFMKNEISAIFDVDTLALINRLKKEGKNKVSALIFNVLDTEIDINTLYGFLTAFTGKNNKTERMNEIEIYNNVNNDIINESIFKNDNNFNTLNTHINGSFYFTYAKNHVDISRAKLSTTIWNEKYPTDREEMELLKKQGLSDLEIANKYDKHQEIIRHNRTQWGSYPSYKLHDGMYIPIYSGDGLNDCDSQLDFLCDTLIIANDNISDKSLDSILCKTTQGQECENHKIYILTNNVELINNLKSKYLKLDEFGYPVSLAIIIAQVNGENIGDILQNNNDIHQVYYHNRDHIKEFERDFIKKEIEFINLGL